jgi:hypothetical protein
MGAVLLPDGVFGQGGCIIDDQPDHIVVAIRLPKALVSENHRLLVALTEAAGGSVVNYPPQSAPPPARQIPAWAIVSTLIAAVVLSIVVPSPIFQGTGIFAHAAAKPAAFVSGVPLGFFAPKP